VVEGLLAVTAGRLLFLTTFGANFLPLPTRTVHRRDTSFPKRLAILMQGVPKTELRGTVKSLWVINQPYEAAQRGKPLLMDLASTGPKLLVHCAHFSDAGKVPVDPILGSELSYTRSRVNTPRGSNS